MRVHVFLGLLCCATFCEASDQPLLWRDYLRHLAGLDRDVAYNAQLGLVDELPPSMLPRRNVRVERMLAGMPGEIEDLNEKRAAVDEAQGKLRGSLSTSMVHLNGLARIKHSIAIKEAQLRSEKHRTHVLQDHEGEIKRAHDKLVHSLHRTMDPKVSSAQARLKKKQDRLHAEQDATKYWGEQEAKVKLEANDAIRDEQIAHKRLQELQEQTEWEKQQKVIAEEKFNYNNHMAQDDVRSLNDAQERYSVEMARLTAAQQAAKAVEKKVHEDESIRAMEQVEDAQRAARLEEDEVQDWKDNVQHISQQADEIQKQNKTAYDALVEVEAKLAWTQQQEDIAKKQYNITKTMAGQEVESLKYVETRADAESSKLKAAEAAADSAEASVRKLEGIRVREEQTINQHLAHGQHALQQKIKALENARGQATKELASLQDEYSSWQADQERMKDYVDRTEQAHEAASQAYEDRQLRALERAQARVYEDATASTGDVWNGEWANEA